MFTPKNKGYTLNDNRVKFYHEHGFLEFVRDTYKDLACGNRKKLSYLIKVYKANPTDFINKMHNNLELAILIKDIAKYVVRNNKPSARSVAHHKHTRTQRKMDLANRLNYHRLTMFFIIAHYGRSKVAEFDIELYRYMGFNYFEVGFNMFGYTSNDKFDINLLNYVIAERLKRQCEN